MCKGEVRAVRVQRVLVVGAGIGGLAAAIAFARRGAEVEVVEIRPNAEVYGVGISQPANALRALRSLGVLDEIREVGFAYDRFQFNDWHGNPIVETPSVLGGDVPAHIALSRVDLHRILSAAAERAGAKITFEVTVRELSDREHGVDAGLTDGRTESYDLVVGFDGVRSALRNRLFGPEYEPVFTGYAVWRVTMPRPADVTNAHLFQGDQTKAGLIPLNEHSMYLLHVTAEPGNPHHDPDRFDELLIERLSGYRGLIGELAAAISGSEGIVYSPLSEVFLPAPWYRGHTVVLGDAAHACAPHLTQGAAMALEDAVVLAEEVSADRPVPASLAAFMSRRFDRVKLVQDVSHQILFSEMAVTAATLPQATEQMRQHVPAQMSEVETHLNQPC